MGRKYLAWASKYMVALWIALVIIAVIAIRPMHWLGSIGFGWVMFWLAVAVAMLFGSLWTYLRSYKGKSFDKAILVALLWGVLIAGPILASVGLWSSRPELSAGEVETLTNAYLNRYKIDYRAVSAEYQGGGIWMIRTQPTSASSKGVIYQGYNERTGKWE